jgi:hypothetical protein
VAITASFTKPKTGAIFPTAHHVLQPPLFRVDSRQVVIKLLVYATKADFTAGKDPEGQYERVFDVNDYTALMNQVKNIVEPALITRFFPAGTRTPD